MSRIDSIISGILKAEGSAYTNLAADRGGPTKYGITQRTLSSYRGVSVSPQDVAALTEAEARKIYHIRYVVQPGFVHVLSISEAIAEELVDSGVNVGTQRASEWLQRVLNVLNRGAFDYPDVKVDGDVGPATLSALRSYLRVRGALGEKVVLRALNCLQGAHYINLAERNSDQETFVTGWFANRVEIA